MTIAPPRAYVAGEIPARIEAHLTTKKLIYGGGELFGCIPFVRSTAYHCLTRMARIRQGLFPKGSLDGESSDGWYRMVFHDIDPYVPCGLFIRFPYYLEQFTAEALVPWFDV